jgi:phosphatidylinositol alpha-1,6-mannosyltransferase
VTHLLVTNDFPPRIGGIQHMLWELWRRLPPSSFAVYTTPYRGDRAWDADQAFPVLRAPEPVLLPSPWLARRVEALAASFGAGLVLLDPAVPLGAIGPWLRVPYGVVLHGAEVTVPGRLPLTRQVLAPVLRGARVVIAGGGYAAAEAERAAGRPLPTTVVPPGVDVDRFRPLHGEARLAARRRLGLPEDAVVVHGGSRLVPRKGFDVLVEALGRLAPARPELVGVISGDGRDRARLGHVARRAGAPVRFLGRLDVDDLADLYACADVFAMLCRTRWGGLEQEGFGIVFVEAAASGTPQLAGASGGAAEAVADGETGVVVRHPRDVDAVTAALARLVDDPGLRRRMGEAARRRAEQHFAYDVLVGRLAAAIEGALGADRAPAGVGA